MSNDIDIPGGEYVGVFECTEEDKKHIKRLRSVRKTGMVNMFTDVRRGLVEVFGQEEGGETYQWIQDNFDYYLSGNWVDQDLDEL